MPGTIGADGSDPEWATPIHLQGGECSPENRTKVMSSASREWEELKVNLPSFLQIPRLKHTERGSTPGATLPVVPWGVMFGGLIFFSLSISLLATWSESQLWSHISKGVLMPSAPRAVVFPAWTHSWHLVLGPWNEQTTPSHVAMQCEVFQERRRDVLPYWTPAALR